MKSMGSQQVNNLQVYTGPVQSTMFGKVTHRRFGGNVRQYLGPKVNESKQTGQFCTSLPDLVFYPEMGAICSSETTANNYRQ
jgi:hypothetical protein